LYIGNEIDDDGATRIAKALKVNTTLVTLGLGSECIVNRARFEDLLNRCMFQKSS